MSVQSRQRARSSTGMPSSSPTTATGIGSARSRIRSTSPSPMASSRPSTISTMRGRSRSMKRGVNTRAISLRSRRWSAPSWSSSHLSTLRITGQVGPPRVIAQPGSLGKALEECGERSSAATSS
ncbi:hypothetical protein A4U61_08415 [Streptomyces sp. H-KF8]|uniref:hypothetical protein n=1 Tax=Streptomyces sp. H-KF8 TaxID=1727216 RepID=UPI0007ED8C82|nr:hypothetical protein [Streptomyces sp. H-KF8]OBQ51675.1 hypothetical protein A4U61_08415 [Streptomyces sp. H-KF8]